MNSTVYLSTEAGANNVAVKILRACVDQLLYILIRNYYNYNKPIPKTAP